MKIIAILVLLTLVIPVSVLAQRGEQKKVQVIETVLEDSELKQQALEEERVRKLEQETTNIDKDIDDIEVSDEQRRIQELKEQSQGTGQGLEQEVVDEKGQIKEGVLGEEKMAKKAVQRGSEKSEERRSQVANAVQEMLMVAERNAGVGQQIRTIAQTQNQVQEHAEQAIQEAQKRSKLVKFFIGPNYGRLKQVEENLGINAEQLKELKELKNQIENPEDVAILEQEIANIEQARADLELEVKNEKKGFSLFGWMNRLFSK